MKYLPLLLLSSCAWNPGMPERKFKKMHMFYNYENEHTQEPFVEKTVTVTNECDDECGRKIYEKWLAQQVISGSAGWSWNE